MVGGFLISVAQAVGIGLAMKWKGAADIGGAVKTALVLWLVFALPFCLYGYLYAPTHNAAMLMIDAGHLFVGWVIAAVAWTFFK
jgi:hypothetical protein